MGRMNPRKPYSNASTNGETHAPRARLRARDRVQSLVQRAQDVSLYVRDQVTTRPVETLAVVAGSSFMIGAIFGSRIARAVLLVAAGYGLRRMIGAGRAMDPGEVMRGWREPGRV